MSQREEYEVAQQSSDDGISYQNLNNLHKQLTFKDSVYQNKKIYLVLFLTYCFLIMFRNNYQFSHQFCLIVAKQQGSIEDFEQLASSLDNQTYSHWQLFYYSNMKRSQMKSFAQFIQTNKFNSKINVKESFGNYGMNYYDAINSQCHPNSVVIILNEGETFYQKNSLEKISKYLHTNPDTYIVGTGVESNGQKIFPIKEILQFSRNKNYENQTIPIYENIASTVRVFKNTYYKNIIITDLMDDIDNITSFYQNPISFIFPLLQMRTPKVNLTRYGVLTKQQQDRVPLFPGIFKQLFIKINNNKIKFDNEASIIFKKNNYSPMIYNLYIGSPLSRTWLDDSNFNIFTRINHPDILIPRYVHQIYLSKENRVNTYLQQAMIQSVKKAYNGYIYHYWTRQNITRNNFPLTFDAITKAFAVLKFDTYNNYEIVKDLMKFQILYQKGGFFIEDSYEPFKNFDQFRNYSLIGCYHTPQSAKMYFSFKDPMGAEPGNKYLQKLLTSIKKLNLLNFNLLTLNTFYLNLFSQIDPDDLHVKVKIFPADKCNAFRDSNNLSSFKNQDLQNSYFIHKTHRCYFKNIQSIPKDVKFNFVFPLGIYKQVMILPCPLYPNAYGVSNPLLIQQVNAG